MPPTQVMYVEPIFIPLISSSMAERTLAGATSPPRVASARETGFSEVRDNVSPPATERRDQDRDYKPSRHRSQS